MSISRCDPSRGNQYEGCSAKVSTGHPSYPGVLTRQGLPGANEHLSSAILRTLGNTNTWLSVSEEYSSPAGPNLVIYFVLEWSCVHSIFPSIKVFSESMLQMPPALSHCMCTVQFRVTTKEPCHWVHQSCLFLCTDATHVCSPTTCIDQWLGTWNLRGINAIDFHY